MADPLPLRIRRTGSEGHAWWLGVKAKTAGSGTAATRMVSGCGFCAAAALLVAAGFKITAASEAAAEGAGGGGGGAAWWWL